MNWLAKISLRHLRQQLGAFNSLLLIVFVLTLVAYSSYRVGNYYHNYQQGLIKQQHQRLDDLYAQQASYEKRLNILNVELDVERMAVEKIEQNLKALDAENFNLKKELAFYQKVMAPEKQADGLMIDKVEIEPTSSDNHYRFRVVLVQTNKQKRYAKGYIEVTLVGSQQNQPTSLDLQTISALDREQLSFSLQYFQVLEGIFTLPEGFSPEQINVAAILPKGKWQKYRRLEQSYPWPLPEQKKA
jgi:hypothetical protein